jgi:hypothetical protein
MGSIWDNNALSRSVKDQPSPTGTGGDTGGQISEIEGRENLTPGNVKTTPGLASAKSRYINGLELKKVHK